MDEAWIGLRACFCLPRTAQEGKCAQALWFQRQGVPWGFLLGISSCVSLERPALLYTRQELSDSGVKGSKQ